MDSAFADPSARTPGAETSGLPDLGRHVRRADDGTRSLHLMVDGLHCAGCGRRVEKALEGQPGLASARLNMTTRRLVVRWDGRLAPDALLAPVLSLGYRLAPFDPKRLDDAQHARERELLRAMAVAGFAVGNVMLFSISLWAAGEEGMGPATRGLFHWLSALVAMPAIAYAGLPFFRSAAAALAQKRTNMDVPISIGVILAAAVSLAETIGGGPHVYFESAVMLLFFLLVGRYLDHRARGRARTYAENLLGLESRVATLIAADGSRHLVPAADLAPGERAFVALGERIPVDGRVKDGVGAVDESPITGETLPRAVAPDDAVFAGSLNVGAPLVIEATATGEGTLLAEAARLVAAAETDRGRYVALADAVARWYAPVVHLTALLTFVAWVSLGGLDWKSALLIAVAVLIVTCPCALALAVPAVQVVGAARLMRRGILVKAGGALERLADAGRVIFDKTGTLTTGRPRLIERGLDLGALAAATPLAAASHHPLARALTAAAAARGLAVMPAAGAREEAGAGVECAGPAGPLRLGSRAFCAVADADAGNADASGDGAIAESEGPELWFAAPGQPPVRFAFEEDLRADARPTVAALAQAGYAVELLSGDRRAAVERVARALGIDEWTAEARPADKHARLAGLQAKGERVAMVGDGLNDAPALARAHVSLSPASALEIARNAADVVFQGERLGPVAETAALARAARRLILQNLAFALLYNASVVPLAIAGLVTPLIAAAAMSASSVVVIANSMRLARYSFAPPRAAGLAAKAEPVGAPFQAPG